MIKDLLAQFPSNSVHRLALVTSISANVIKTFEQEFGEDHATKDAAIDILVTLLQSQKGCKA